MKNEVHLIEDINEFKFTIRNNVLKTFLLTFLKSSTILDQYDEDLLTVEILDFWIGQYIKKKKKLHYIQDSDVMKLEKEIYKDFVEMVLGKLVDKGILVMCWDSDIGSVVWKNTKDEI
jgi:hypothetical protein